MLYPVMRIWVQKKNEGIKPNLLKYRDYNINGLGNLEFVQLGWVNNSLI